jgi:hypothetical protein
MNYLGRHFQYFFDIFAFGKGQFKHPLMVDGRRSTVISMTANGGLRGGPSAISDGRQVQFNLIQTGRRPSAVGWIFKLALGLGHSHAASEASFLKLA